MKSQNDLYIEKIRHLEEDLQLSQENLQITIREREDWKAKCSELEKGIADLRLEFKIERQHFKETEEKATEEKTALEGKIKTLENDHEEVCSREKRLKDEFQSCYKALHDLEKKVTSFNKGFQCLRKIMDGVNFQEVFSVLNSLQDNKIFASKEDNF